MNENEFYNMRNFIRNESIPAAICVELSEQEFLKEDLNESIHSEWLQPLINGDLSYQDINQRRATIAKAIIEGIKRGAIKSMTPEEIASLIDEAVIRIIVGKKVAEGNMDPIEALELFFDHTAVRVVTVADHIITKVEKGLLQKSDIIADTAVGLAAKGLKAVASAFPPTRILVPFIEVAAEYIKPAARAIVKEGIKIIANVARTVVKKAAPFITKKVKQLGRTIKKCFSSIF